MCSAVHVGGSGMEKEIESALAYIELHVQIHVHDLMSSICVMSYCA